MDSVQVFARVRSLNTTEKEKGAQKVVKCSDNKISVNDKSYQVVGFGPEVSNDQFYNNTLQNIVLQAVTKGINLGLVCVGESKSGKSTSLGTATSPGLVALTAASLFDHVTRYSWFVGVTYLNIYNDKFTDLLNPADKELKVKTQANMGVYVDGLSELSVKSSADLIRLYDQGNKVRKILELELNTPSTKCHTVFSLHCEYRAPDNNNNLTRSTIQFYNIAGLNHSGDSSVANSLKTLQGLVSESSSGKQSGFNGSKLTQLLRTVMDKSAYLVMLGHLSPTGVDTTTATLDLLTKCQNIQLSPKPNTLDTQQLIEELRKRVSVARNAITAQSSGNIAKEHIAELDNSLAALGAAKRLQWDARERASALAEEQRRETLADQGVLEWITQTATQIKNNTSSVLLLQKDKENLVAEYKKQRGSVDKLKTELQSSISSHTALAEQPNQSETVLQESLANIHKLRDQLKAGNDKLRELKKGVKETQDKLKLERTQSSTNTDLETAGNFALTLMIKRDEIAHLKRDNEQFLEEERERLQTDAVQETAEVKLAATQGSTLTLEQIVKLQEQHVQQSTQLAHLALHVQCLQAENEKLTETLDALNHAHKTETESQKARNLLTFRQYKDFYEEAKVATNSRYQELLNSCAQDCIFLSSKNAELTEENAELKRKLKHFN